MPMPPRARSFQITGEPDLAAIAAALADAVALAGVIDRGPPRHTRAVLLDSFDWRLWRAGAALEWREPLARNTTGTSDPDDAPTGPVLMWHGLQPEDPAADSMLDQQPAAAPPGLLDSLADGPVRERLASVLGIRRLLPAIAWETSIHTLDLCDDAGVPLLRLTVETCRLCPPCRPDALTPAPRVWLRPLAGQGQSFRALLAGLPPDPRFPPAGASLPAELLAAASRTPGGYQTRLNPRLDPDGRAEAALRGTLRELLAVINDNLPGAREALDPEFLHDLRVATRRTRAVLGQARGVLPAAALAQFKERFRWLQQVTGPVRDLDVYLLKFPALLARVPTPLRPDLNPLRGQLQAEWQQEQAALVAALDGEPLRALLADWAAFLATPVADGQAEQASMPPRALADARIRRVLRQVRRDGRAIDAESPDLALHELRKRTKKLRYLLEFFQGLYPRAEARALINETKTLLDNLGAIQDLAVQAGHLRHTALAMHAGGAPVPTLLALGALIGAILNERALARAEFDRLFAQFDSRSTRRRFRGLFEAPVPAQGGG